MQKRRAISITLVVITIIVGGALLKLIDLEAMTVEKPALAGVYLFVVGVCIYLMLKRPKGKPGM